MTAKDLLPNPTKPFAEHTDLQLLAMVLFGEARGQPTETREGIGHAIINRALKPAWWGNNLKEVILKPYQFSSFIGPEITPNSKAVDPNYEKVRNPLKFESEKTWQVCCDIALKVYQRLEGKTIPDIVVGANHYYDTSIPPPKWADPLKLTVQMPAGGGKHFVRFYKL